MQWGTRRELQYFICKITDRLLKKAWVCFTKFSAPPLRPPCFVHARFLISPFDGHFSLVQPLKMGL